MEAECNAEHENLHFGVRVRVSPTVLQALYDIGLDAWQAVRGHQSWEAAFWFYKWFLLVANVCLEIWDEGTQPEYSALLVTRLAHLVIDISQMTTKKEYQGDILKRLYEALTHVLLAFGKSHNLTEVVTRSARETNNARVIEFVGWTIEGVREIEQKRPRTGPGQKE